MSDPAIQELASPDLIPPKIKMCGITTPHDALLCAEAGADALGFIFASGSKRLVSAAAAREAGLSVGPAIARVGVFMNQGLDEVLRTAEAARVSAVQLHGDLSRLYIETISAYYPVLRVLKPASLRQKDVWQERSGVTLMLDAPTPGSGMALDWPSLQADFPAGSWLAGGLGSNNVAEAIRLLRPAGVDAVSHLEARPGIKNPQAVRAFVDAVKRS